MGVLIRRDSIEKPCSPDAEVAIAAGAPAADAGDTHALDTAEVLRLEPADDPARYVHRLAAASRVEVNFPAFTDGRGYSTARLLRERYGYRGELRAVGDVQHDQLLNLARCGFDSFLLRKDEDAADASSAFDEFSEAYQASVERPLPLFRRRLP